MSNNIERYDIRAVLEGLGYRTPAGEIYDAIKVWQAWYQGYVQQFHDYTQYNGRRRVKRRRKTLRMAEQVCADHANLLLNEKVQLVLSSKTAQEKIDATLKACDFRVEANKLVEVAFALGTGAFVEHEDGKGGCFLDYIRADMIYPIDWERGKVTSCAFASVRPIEGKDYIYINIHQATPEGYVIRNELIPMDEQGQPLMQDQKTAKGKPKPQRTAPAGEDKLLPGGLLPEVHTGSQTPRFQLFGPNKVNNVVWGSPLGVSVFANSIDLLEGIDLVYDSYCGEFRLGKKRIIVPQTMLQLMTDGDGDAYMAFDDNDTEFYGLKDDNLQEIKEINMELRIDAHDQAIQRFVNFLSAKCGLGNDRYKFEGNGLKTATEVVSEKSELYQNLCKNELVIEQALTGMCHAIAEICGIREAFDVEVNFDDSIIQDSEAKRARIQVMLSGGQFPLKRYLVEYEGYSEKDAEAIMAEIEEEAPEELPVETGPGADGDETDPAKNPFGAQEQV